MDVVQVKLQTLLRQSDIAFEEYKKHPNSPDRAEAYESAKLALDEYIANMRTAYEKRLK
ncbi:hypothetical protein [Paraglaciecola sp. L1A13]|jgi:hypothetical protein|uniref:hypothetical protein n=1 Tax=Paraglaciecola sp. L1A13 TaxID=2686359 RepID=UPI0018EEE4EB|nr:hypothetical protein [Paraglaciecola sp. L1A13]|tara:strand:+ start:3174 stop:3350 length:177 start_codon:yes stop_codon:yes gene_type:complete